MGERDDTTRALLMNKVEVTVCNVIVFYLMHMKYTVLSCRYINLMHIMKYTVVSCRYI